MAAPRSIGTVTIQLGVVAIAAKLFTATSKRKVEFHRLERATGARVKQPTVSSVTGRLLDGDDVVSGYEYTPGKYVVFEAPELKALEQQAQPDRLRVVAVVPAATLDPTHIVGSAFLGPNKGADRAYHLLASLLAHRGLIAIGTWGGRTRDEIVVLAPHISSEGLVLHDCYYPDEVRSSTLAEAVPPGVPLGSRELELGGRLLGELTQPSFRLVLDGLVDGGAKRVTAAVERKVDGREVVVPPPRADSSPLDLLEQLEASLARGPKKARPAAAPASRKRARAS
ncbi:MAG: hypothetical protein KF764_08690 [Labilithrix sp.]|nr:hypothetical protein [Labilithrix sp.]